MNNAEYENLKSELIKTALKSITDDGYARMGKVFYDVTKDEEFNKQEIEDKSFLNSLSALVIKKAKYIREPIFNKEHEIKDYNVLLNPANKGYTFQKWALRGTIIFSIFTLIIQIINLRIIILDHSGDKQSKLQQLTINLKPPSQHTDTLIIYQNQNHDTNK